MADERRDDAMPSATEDGAVAPWADLEAQQTALERGMIEQGRARHRRRAEAARRADRAGDLASGVALVDRHVAPLAAAIAAYLAHARSRRAGRPPAAAAYLARVTPEQAAFLTMRTLLHGLAKPTSLSRLAFMVADAIEDEARFADLRRRDARLFDRLERRARRRSSYRRRRALFLHAADALRQDWTPWTERDRELLGLRLIDLTIESVGLVEIVDRRRRGRSAKVVALTQPTADWMSRIDLRAETLNPVFEPMLVAPSAWTKPHCGGYRTRFPRPVALVKSARRAYLDDLACQDMPGVYQAVNAAQATAWRVNRRVLRVMEALWQQPPRDWAPAVADIALLGPGGRRAAPAPTRPHGLDHMRADARRQALAGHAERSRRWREAEQARRSKVATAASMLRSARRFQRFERLYFPMTLDFRGRLYAIPAFNPQGSDAMRALLEFATGEAMDAIGARWLAIHLCNCGDFEKMSKAPLEDRARWTLANQERILTVAADPLADAWWTEADNPWQFLAACFEWADHVEQGPRFVSRLPVALDGSCSGIQHFSLALRDDIGGAAVNLAPQARASDIYQQVADAVNLLLETDLGAAQKLACGRDEAGAPRAAPVAELARDWLDFGVDRAVCKRPTMTYGYGARGYGYTEQILIDTLEPALEAHRRGQGAWPFRHSAFASALYLAGRITEAVEQVVVKASEAMRWLQSTASLAAAEDLPMLWTTPDGFPVLQAYPETRSRRIRTVLGGKSCALSIREPSGRIDARRQRQGVSPNFVHSLDAAHLRLTVARASAEGIRDFALIHDSFGVHAARTERFFRLIRETMVEMYDAVDVVASFRADIAGMLSPESRARLAEPPEKGALALSAVIDSEFCFA